MTNKPYERHFTIPSGSVLKTGGSLNLSDGQLGLFLTMDGGVDGLTCLYNLKGQSKDTLMCLREGRGMSDDSRTQSEKDFSSPNFTLADVISVGVSLPTRDKISVDEVVLGYNGIDESTAIKLNKGQQIPVALRLNGTLLGMLGYKEGELLVTDFIGTEPCDFINPMEAACTQCSPCEATDCSIMIKEFIQRMRRKPIQGLKTLGDYVEITPVLSCATDPATLIPSSFWTTSLCDTGDDMALALVQKQYPTNHVFRIDRKGAISTYQMLRRDSAGSPANGTQTFESMVKGCASCPPSYTKLAGGFVYSVSIVDNGASAASIIETLPTAKAGSAVRHSGSETRGFYTVVLTTKLTLAQIQAFATTNPTFIVEDHWTVGDFCKMSSSNTFTWTKGETCNATVFEFNIDVPDNECGGDRLADLRNSFPELTIEKEGEVGGCITRYKTSVETNLVCAECDPIYKDFYIAQAPRPFDGISWTSAEPIVINTDCLCGVRFKGKVLEIDPGECFLDEMDYIEDSIKIQVSAGLPEMNTLNASTVNNKVHVTRLSEWKPRTHLGANLRRWENQGYTYFTGEQRSDNAFARRMRKQQTKLEGGKQYADFVIQIRPKKYGGGLSDRTEDTINFHIVTELGRTADVLTLLNNIAAAAGVSTIRDFGL